jgi:hypothetical protein
VRSCNAYDKNHYRNARIVYREKKKRKDSSGDATEIVVVRRRRKKKKWEMEVPKTVMR